MKIFLDTEFDEDGREIRLLSVALVKETGERLYIVIEDADRDRVNDFVKENVLPYLDIMPPDSENHVVPRAEAGAIIRSWVGPRPEFWAWYGAYDWIVMAQLQGTMADIPPGWPMFVRDLRQTVADRKISWLPELTEEQSMGLVKHHAMYDAVELKLRYDYTEYLRQAQG